MFEPWELGLLEECRVARLATIARDGEPRLVPVCYALAGGAIAIAIDEKPKRTTRLARLTDVERDPRVTLLADRYDEDWSRLAWVRVDGRAEVVARGDEWPEAMAALRARYAQYAGMHLEDRPMLRIAPVRVTSWLAKAEDARGQSLSSSR